MTSGVEGGRQKTPALGLTGGQDSLEHYLRLLLHRRWLVLGIFLPISLATAIISYYLPNIYLSETVILVDPQKVPETYVKATVTGDIRNRLGTLSQQIMSATRLQKIIETFNLYPGERKTLAREDVITRMRSDISVSVVSDFGASQDLQAFRITYSGQDPRLVAQVTNQLASLFIEENLKAREQQATGTTEFLQNQLQDTRKALEEQEAKLKAYKLRHIGELPDQQTATLQILGQLQSQLQQESDALGRAEQQKSYIQSMMAQSAPVLDVDDFEPQPAKPSEKPAGTAQTPLATARARLATLMSRYTEVHPEVRKLKRQIEEEEAKQKQVPVATAAAPAAEPAPPRPANVKRPAPPPANHFNPVLQAQLKVIDAEIAKHNEEHRRLSRLIQNYRVKLEAIPVREQELTELVRDYEISKTHYKQLLEKQLSAETATQLEIRQKGEKFSILDPAQVAERPSRPNRTLINVAGSLAGLILGLVIAVATEFFGMSITATEHIARTSLPVLEVIPVIRTEADRAIRKKRMVMAAASGMITALAACAILFYHFRSQIF